MRDEENPSPVVRTGLVEAFYADVLASYVDSPAVAHPIPWFMVMLLGRSTCANLNPPRSIYRQTLSVDILRPDRLRTRLLGRRRAGVAALTGCSRPSPPRRLRWSRCFVGPAPALESMLRWVARSRVGVCSLPRWSRCFDGLPAPAESMLWGRCSCHAREWASSTSSLTYF